MLLVPFREDFFVEEHLTVFDTPHVAIKEGDYSLVYAASKQCYSEYYNAEQLLLIYSRADQDRDAVKLSDLVEHICNKEHKATQTDWQSMNDQLYLANTELNTLKAQQYPQQITQQVEDALLSLKEQSETIRRLETSCQSTKQVLDDLNLMKKVKEAQEKLNVEKGYWKNRKRIPLIATAKNFQKYSLDYHRQIRLLRLLAMEGVTNTFCWLERQRTSFVLEGVMRKKIC